MNLLVELFSIVAPLYVCAGIGFGWVKSGRVFPTSQITELIMGIGAPCLVFSRLVELSVPAEAMARLFGAALLAVGACLALGALALRLARLPLSAFLPAVTFGNTGNMGLPVALFAFGEPGLALAVCYFAATASCQFSIGVAISSGRLSLRELSRTPLILAVALAAIVIATRVSVPEWIARTTGILGDFTIPLMQITLGASLATLRARGLSRSLALGALRMGMGLSVGFALAELLALEGIARSVLIVNGAMPAAVFNYLIAQRYGRRPEEVASVVMLSTLLAFGTLPLLLALVL